MAKKNTTYRVRTAFVKVSVGAATGTRVARILRQGALIPEGVEQTQLDGLVKRKLIEEVTETSDAESGPQAPAANAGEDKWRSYAEAIGVEVPADADKARIRELVDAHAAAAAGTGS